MIKLFRKSLRRIFSRIVVSVGLIAAGSVVTAPYTRPFFPHALAALPTSAKAAATCKQSAKVKCSTVKQTSKSVSKKQSKRKKTARAPINCQTQGTPEPLCLFSHTVLVVDQKTGEPLFERNADTRSSIASITKLMTAMVSLEGSGNVDELLTVTKDDIAGVPHWRRLMLKPGMTATRSELLRLLLMSSNNTAARTLARSYPSGYDAFIRLMNNKAQALGMSQTRFVDPAGLDSGNVSTSWDLVKLVDAAQQQPLIAKFTTTAGYYMSVGRREILVRNTNRFVGNDEWNIGVSKTGHIQAAGSCLVMQVTLDDRPLVIVLLSAQRSKYRARDVQQLRNWLEKKLAQDGTA